MPEALGPRDARARRRGGILLALLLGCAPAWAAEGAAELPAKQDELQQARQRIQRLKKALESNKARRQALLGELRASEEQIGRSSRRLRELARRLREQQAGIEVLQGEQRQQRQELTRQRQALAQQLRAAYAMGRQQRLKILLNQQDPALAGRMMVYYDYFNRARTRQMDRIGETLASLQGRLEQIAGRQRQLQELQAHELEQRQRLEASRARRRQLVQTLGQEIEDQGQRLARLEQDAKQLQQLVDRLREQQAALPVEGVDLEPFKRMRGRLEWPVKGRIEARFGSRRAGSLRWDGVFIAAPEGREVGAVYHGRVVFADWLRGFGLLLIIDHGDGYMSLYGHNQSLFREVGDWVESGEVIAAVGRSGGLTRSGLYFAVRYRGGAVNPRTWCRRG